MFTKRQREFYNAHREYVFNHLHITRNQYNWLRRKGLDLHKIYEQNCNGVLSEELYEKLTNKYYKEVETYVKSLGLYVYFQTDPRGATIYVDAEEIPYNNYTRAHCIY